MGVDNFPNGDVYDGEFIDGLPEGKGSYLWKKGAMYQGDFKQGMKHGMGVWKQQRGDPNTSYFEG